MTTDIFMQTPLKRPDATNLQEDHTLSHLNIYKQFRIIKNFNIYTAYKP